MNRTVSSFLPFHAKRLWESIRNGRAREGACNAGMSGERLQRLPIRTPMVSTNRFQYRIARKIPRAITCAAAE
jgi:hypothetical protein